MTYSPRKGTILIVVAGISALLSAMALTFLVRMRSDVEESSHTVREAQAHIMMIAGCNFVMESARLGWDISKTQKVESFGWVDVRTGEPGPRDYNGNQLGIGTWVDLGLSASSRPAKRAPMFVMVRPPFAVSPRVATNPIETSGTDAFKPYLRRADPQPVHESMSRIEYVDGDKRMDLSRYIPTWFRVWRASPSTFVITCGVGETQGFRNWQEVKTAGMETLFGGDNQGGESTFLQLQNQEVRLWYLIQWSAHVAGADYHHFQNEFDPNFIDAFFQQPINVSQDDRSQGKQANPVGTIQMIQRLLREPDVW